MKIVHIIPSLKKGGAERLAIDICNQLAAINNIEVVLVSLSDINHYSFCIKCRHELIPSEVYPSITGKSTANVDNLFAFFQEFNPDIIHTHLFSAELIARWNLLPKVKYFSHCHDNIVQLTRFKLTDIFIKKRLTQLFEKRLIEKKYKQCNNVFIAISNHTKEYFKKNLPRSLKKSVILLPNAIKYNRFYSNVEKRQEKLTIINVGNFLPKKNPKLAVMVAEILLQREIDFKMILVGDGDQKTEIEKYIKQNNLADYFELPGFVDDVENWLSQSDIYLHTAIYEPFGLVLIEAMAAGLPVVALDGLGNRDIIEQGKNGFIIKDQDPNLFTDHIFELKTDKKRYSEMSQYCQIFAKQYDIKEYVDRLIDIYRQ
jgi:glycosyltransferase involved in cell wall biosynthesis